MSKTPRTDKIIKKAEDDDSGISEKNAIFRDLARELEGELAGAHARIKILERVIDDMTEEQAAICAEGQSVTELVASLQAAGRSQPNEN